MALIIILKGKHASPHLHPHPIFRNIPFPRTELFHGQSHGILGQADQINYIF